MSTQRTITSSHSRWKYDVFLSFRGDDTRKAFTDHLYTALEKQRIITFRDEPQLQKGKAISLELFSAIEESRFALIVLSQNYASSTWCLDELVRILECMKARDTVLPIFYNVDPSDVRKQSGSFGEPFTKQEERFGDDKEKLQKWRCALTQVASFSGWNSKEWYESELIEDIIAVIWKKLQPTLLFRSEEKLVGIDSRLQPINLHLGAGEDDVRFIGIWGMGGIGKTTLVREVHERITCEFEHNFFLTDVRNSVEKSGLPNLQKQLLAGIWTRKDDILDPHEGATIIRRLLGQKKVLLILDDVNDPNHIKYLAGNQEWFGSGSRVLITTRDEHLLIQYGVERRLKVEELNADDSLKLFSWKAFERDCPENDFLGLSKFVVKYAQGLPLALNVLGSFLRGRGLSEWDSALSKLGRVCDPGIFKILKISYDDLDYEQKKIFLDVACFFNGEDKDRVTEVLTSVSTTIDIEVLKERSLLNLLYGRLWMHDLLREMGREIVRQESLAEPGKRSRLWLCEDINYVLSKNVASDLGTEAIEGIFVDSTESGGDVDVNAKAFSLMSKLRYLKINNGNLPNGLECLPNSLRILQWTGYPLKSLPQHFNLEKMIELSLCHSCFTHFHPGMEIFNNLKSIYLSHSVNLLSTPDFRVMPYLEVLTLEGCKRLYKVDPSIEVLSRLKVLNLKDCKNLVHFAGSLHGLKSLKVLDLSGCSKLDKLPGELGHVDSLEKLDVSGTGIREVPSLKNLKELSLRGCKAQSPKSSWNMIFKSFELLRKTSYVPGGLSLPWLSGLPSLTKLDLSDCNLFEVAMPSDVGCLSSLTELDLSRNQFVELPKSICQLSKLKELNLDGCFKLQTLLSELPSHVSVRLSNCISLDTLSNCNSALSAQCFNCFKMVENESFESIALPLLMRYLEEPEPEICPYQLKNPETWYFNHLCAYCEHDIFEFVAPGNETPKWYNRRSEGSSIVVELHPGWFSNRWMGFALCAVFRLRKPLPENEYQIIYCSLEANGVQVGSFFPCVNRQEWGQPVSDHIWLFYLHRDRHRFLGNNWQDIYYQLKFSFNKWKQNRAVEVKNCGVRMIYEEDVKELRQILWKQSNVGINTKPGLQQYDDTANLGQEEEEEPHPKRFKQLDLDLDLDGAGPCGSACIVD